MQRTTYWLIGTLLLALSGCCSIGAPPKRIPRQEEPTAAESTIEIPISISAGAIKKALLSGLSNPVASGTTDRISVKILATESITVRETIRVLVSPAKPGYYKKAWKRTTRTVKKAYRCLLKPWKWGKCWKDVVEVVMVPYQVWVPPVKAVYKLVSKPITNLLDRVYPTGAWVHYTVHLQDFDLSFDRDKVKAIAKFKVDLKLDYEQAVVPLGPKIKIKGLLSGNILADIELDGSIKITDSAKLEVDIPKDGGKIRFRKVFVPTAVEVFDHVAILNPLLLAQKKLLGKLVNRLLTKKIKDAIAKKDDKLSFGERINDLVRKSSDAHRVADDTWFIPNPIGVSVSQPNGSGGNLNLSVGLRAKPDIVFTLKKPVVQVPSKVPFKVKAHTGRVEIYARGVAAFDKTAQLLSKELGKLVDEKFGDKGYSIGKTKIYPSRKRIVVGIDLIKKETKKRFLTFYAWGIPKLHQNGREVSLDELDFTVDTKNVLAKCAAWLLEDRILQLLKDKAKFDFGKPFDQVAKRVKSFTAHGKWGSLKGGLSTVRVDSIFVGKTGLTALAHLKGRVSVHVGALDGVKIAGRVVPKIAVPKRIELSAGLTRLARLLRQPRARAKGFKLSKRWARGIKPLGPLVVKKKKTEKKKRKREEEKAATPKAIEVELKRAQGLAVVNDLAYVGTTEGKILVVDLGAAKVIERIPVGPGILNLAVQGDTLYILCAKALYKLPLAGRRSSAATKNLAKGLVGLSSPFVKLGDTIYFHDYRTGKVKSRKATLKDVNVSGDTVLLEIDKGVIVEQVMP